MKVWMTKELEELYFTGKSKVYKDVVRSPELYRGFYKAVNAMKEVVAVDDLARISYLHYEKLKHQLSGYSSVRLSNRYVHRLLFTESEDGFELKLIEIDNTHYGNKS